MIETAVTKPKIRVVMADGRAWVKVTSVSDEFLCISPSKRNGRQLGPCVVHWIAKHVPRTDRRVMVSGPVETGRRGCSRQKAVHVSTTHLEALMAYAKSREDTRVHRASISHATRQMERSYA